MLDEYYELHGWSQKTGLQKREILEELNLHSVAQSLIEAGKL
jgi:hypothetical protein